MRLRIALTRSIGVARRRWATRAGDERGVEVLALGLLFLGGAVTALVSETLPEAPQVNWQVGIVLAAIGLPVGTGVLFFGRRLSRLVEQGLLAGGSCLTAAGAYLAHGTLVGAAVAVFYVWVAMFAFHFFSLRAAMVQLGISAAAYAAALGVVGAPGWGPVWVLMMGTAAVAGAVMLLFSRQMRRMAVTDQLTGLPNRHVLDTVLSLEMSRAKRADSPLAIAIVDVDGLKAVNDRLGHGAGDNVLRTAASGWATALRQSDTLVRYGGDEFLLVMPGAALADAEAVLERMIGASPVAASAGVAQYHPAESLAQLLTRADAALYAEKRARLRSSPSSSLLRTSGVAWSTGSAQEGHRATTAGGGR